VKGWKKIYQANDPNQDKEDHFILMKGAIHKKAISITYPYAPNVSAPNFIKHTLNVIKAHIDPNTVVVGDFILLCNQ
jgi:hypothetical protein